MGAVVLAIAAVSIWLQRARGEFWIGQNYDPSYLYLFGALDLAEGVATPFVDHPGVPLQLLGAAVLRLRGLADGGALSATVLADPENALAVIVTTLVGLHLVVCLAVGAVVLRRTSSRLRASLGQSSFLLSATLAGSLLYFKAEALLATLMLVAGTLVVLCAETKSDNRQLRLALAVVVGLAVATKITAAPFLLLLAIGPRRAAERLGSMSTAAATALLATFPWSDGLDRFAGYLGRLALRRGLYGHGAVGFEDPARLADGLVRLASREPLLTATLVAGALTLLRGRGKRSDGEAQAERRRWLLALVASATALVLLATKQPNPRFLVPALAVVGPLWSIVVGVTFRPGHPRWPPIAAVAVLLTAAVFVAAPAFVALRGNWQLVAAEGRQAAATAQRLQRDGARPIPYFWGSSPQLALWLGNRAVRFRYAAELDRLHPGFVVFDVWRWGYRGFSGSLGGLAADVSAPEIVLHGKRLEADGQLGAITQHRDRSFWPPFARAHPADELEVIWSGSAEAIYRLRAAPGATEPSRRQDAALRSLP